jgi:hypothetical protein
MISRLSDGGEVVSLTHRPRSTSQKHYCSASGSHCCYRLSKPHGLVRLEALGEVKNIHSSHLVLNPRFSGL